MKAADLARDIARRAHRLKSAAFLPDETISVNGGSIECYVIHYSEKDFKTLRNDDLKQDDTLWIDKSRKLVIKTLSRMETYILTEAHGHIPIHTETTVIYPVVELDKPEPVSSFTFVVPSDAKLVAEFPNYFLTAAGHQGVDLAGKPVPEFQLKSSDGKITPLSSFRGKPVFLEFWATWCSPCVDLMPELTKLYLETASKGLVWMSVDSDEDSADAAKFISEEHIPWPNYHDGNGSLGKAFQREGIPLGVLVDADGKVTFYKSGYEISDLRAAIAKLGPEFSSVDLANPGSK
ncbi:MAG: TlpA family protein disulfide reductase [Candidatus Sulfotelmatobacter sp.]